MKEFHHIPVLLDEVIEYLNPKPNLNFIDGSIGGGGHSEEILKRTSPNGKLLGIDLDKDALKASKKRLSKDFKNRFVLIKDNFKNLKKIYKANNIGGVSGIILDIGLSSYELEDERRGFSFKFNAPLDMRFSGDGVSARDIINGYSQTDLSEILKNYGEERFAKNIAKNICAKRKENSINSTSDLVDVIAKSVPGWYKRKKIHFATKTFQALRIEVNDELNNLKTVLPDALDILVKGGRLAIISFHSLEDRIVKNFFKEQARNCICPKDFPICQCNHKAIIKIITKKVVVATRGEIKNNPKARSAKLRVAEKINICLGV